MTDLKDTKISIGDWAKVMVVVFGFLGSVISYGVWDNVDRVKMHDEIRQIHEENKQIMNALKIVPALPPQSYTDYVDPDLSKLRPVHKPTDAVNNMSLQ